MAKKMILIVILSGTMRLGLVLARSWSMIIISSPGLAFLQVFPSFSPLFSFLAGFSLIFCLLAGFSLSYFLVGGVVVLVVGYVVVGVVVHVVGSVVFCVVVHVASSVVVGYVVVGVDEDEDHNSIISSPKPTFLQVFLSFFLIYNRFSSQNNSLNFSFF